VKRAPATVLGAEYDGTVLRLVRMHGHSVVRYQTFSANTTEAAHLIREQVDRNTTCMVAWGSPGSMLRRSPLPGLPRRQLPLAARELLNRQLPAGAHRPGAGMAISGLHSPTPSAAVGAITAEGATFLLSQLGTTRCSLVVAPFTLEHDGLYLAIRNSGAELILVTAGIAVASRQLRTGGLSAASGGDPLASDLAGSTLHHVADGDLGDPEAVATARRYVAALVREVRRTTEHWEAAGESCPPRIWIYGPGATLPHLPSFMLSIGLIAQAPPVSPELELSEIPTPHRLAAYGALSAAVAAAGPQELLDLSQAKIPRRTRSLDLNSGNPFAGFEGVINASGTRGFATPRRAHQRPEPVPRGTVFAFVALVLAIAVAVVGWWISGSSLEDSSRELAAAERLMALSEAQAEFSSEVSLIAESLTNIEIDEATDWDAAITPLMIYLPASPVAESVLLSETGDSLTARIRTPTALTDLPQWRNALRRAGTLISVNEMPAPTSSDPNATLTEFVLQIFSPLPELPPQVGSATP
jgi:hypothetical protein